MNSTHILYGLLILAGLGLVGIFILRLLIKNWNKGIDNKEEG